MNDHPAPLDNSPSFIESWFVILQKRSTDPILPLRLLRDRNRSGSYAAMLEVVRIVVEL
jgi:hypothetical protein